MSDRLLDSVSYVSRKAHKAKDLTGDEIDVFDTFPFNTESKTSPATALSWAKGGSRYYSPMNDEVPEPVVTVLSNEPFKVRILNLEVRSEGGRAYKVIDEQNRRFDLREDQLIEAIRHEGIQPGGTVGGKFVWGVSGSQVKMVLVGGKLHAQMGAYAEQVKTEKAIPLSQLVVGRTYLQRSKHAMTYIGRVSHPDLDGTMHAFVSVHKPADGFMGWTHDENGSQKEKVYAPEGLTNFQYTLLAHDFWQQRSTHKYKKSVTLQKSPKLYGVLDSMDDVTAVTNDPHKFRYENGNGESIAECTHEKKNGPRKDLGRWGYYRNDEYARMHAERAVEVAQTEKEFIDQLVWK